MQEFINPLEIKIEDFTYQLPTDNIPKYPLDQRDQSKLLVYKNNEIEHHVFSDIKNHLAAETMLVFNDSKLSFEFL